jgi:molecular chaperone DnaK
LFEPSFRAEIDHFVEVFAVHIAANVDAKVNTKIHRLAGAAREALTQTSPHSVEDARRSFDELRDLLFVTLAKRPQFWVLRFESLAEDRHLAIDKNLHDRLVHDDGEMSIGRMISTLCAI